MKELHTHCWNDNNTTADHSDCENCCGCNIRYKNVTHDSHVEIKRVGEYSDEFTKIIGSLILYCGNLYNENQKDITIDVAELINNKLIK